MARNKRVIFIWSILSYRTCSYPDCVSRFCISAGSVATFSLNSLSAPIHTLVECLSWSLSKCGSRALLKASLASRGIREGRWSMDMTLSGGPVLMSTGTVGFSKVVLML